MSNQNLIQNLLDVPVEERDEAWETAFLKALPETALRIVNDAPVEGVDGWPYLLVSTDIESSDQKAELDELKSEPFLKVAQWVVTRGIGMVINPEKPIPDYVISYGMMWNLRERGEFFTHVEKSDVEPGAKYDPKTEAKVELRHGQQVYAGPPSNHYLPQDVRSILREFLKQQKVLNPKVLMISHDQKEWDLAFSLESLGNVRNREQAGIAEAISWFLPGHYSVVLMKESALPGFVEL